MAEQICPRSCAAIALLTIAVAPLAPFLILLSSQTRQGECRTSARAARNKHARPTARLADLDAWRERRRTQCRPAADRKNPRTRVQRAGHHRHGDVGRTRRDGGCRRTSSTSSCRSIRRAIVARFLDHWQPDLALFVESDLWPNLIVASAARNIPLILVNGRLSERSFRRWRLAPARDHRAAQPLRSLSRAIDGQCHALRRARRAPHHHHRQSQARRSRAAGRCRETRRAQVRRSPAAPSSPPRRPIRAKKPRWSTPTGASSRRTPAS